MTSPATAERITNVLRQRGIPSATVQQYRAVLDRADDVLRIKMTQHLARVASAVDDSDSMRWLAALTSIARDGWAEVAPFHDLAPLVLVATDVAGREDSQPHSEPAKLKRSPGAKASAEQRARDRQTVHVYGARAALCVELDRLRPDEAGREKATLTIEAASRRAGKSYAWDSKVSIQLGIRELPAFVGTVMGWSQEWIAKAHGRGHDKELIVRNQAGGVQIVVRQGADAHSVPVTFADTYDIVNLALKALLENDPHLSSETALQLCRRASGRAW
jgi:hypothetical protein